MLGTLFYSTNDPLLIHLLCPFWPDPLSWPTVGEMGRGGLTVGPWLVKLYTTPPSILTLVTWVPQTDVQKCWYLKTKVLFKIQPFRKILKKLTLIYALLRPCHKGYWELFLLNIKLCKLFLYQYVNLSFFTTMYNRSKKLSNKFYPNIFFLNFSKLHICSTLRSWLHEIPALIMTLSPGLEKNYTSERSSKCFPGMTSMSGYLENCQKYIPKSQCSPIQETMS